VIRIDDERVREHLGHIVRGTVEETLVPKLRQQTFETAIIERYRRRESSVEEALIEMSYGQKTETAEKPVS
jgi:transposase-like protein